MFDIDASTLFVSLLFVFALSSPFIYYSLKNKKNYKIKLEAFLNFSKSVGANPTQIENWRNQYFLGYDPVAKTLVYLNGGSTTEQTFINLGDVKKISLHEKAHHVESEMEKRNVLDYLAIQFIFKDHCNPEKSIEIYNSELFTGLDGEMMIAKKWIELLNNQLKN